jgi:hypothetical protein
MLKIADQTLDTSPELHYIVFNAQRQSASELKSRKFFSLKG